MASAVSQNNPTTQADSPPPLPPVWPVRHRLSVEQYHEMIEKGIFGPEDKIELIRGELVEKMVIGKPHVAMVNRLNRLFSKLISESLMLSIQNPILLSDSEPEPDVAVLDFRDDFYGSALPGAKDVRLLIEVAETSLEYDRQIKGAIYAEAGIQDYWIVNLNNSTVEVYRDPQPEGRFGTVVTLKGDDRLKPLAIKNIELPVREFLANG